MKKIIVFTIVLFTCVSSIFATTNLISSDSKKLQPVIQEFKTLLENDSIIRMNITKMIEQIPKDKKNIKDIDDLLFQLNQILTTAPEFNKDEVLACPFSKLFVWCMCTTSGFDVFRNEKVNTMLRNVLKTWESFLNSKDSLYVINDTDIGWKCSEAKKLLKMDDYVYNSNDKYWGFKSWNDFFTRKLKPQARPISQPNNNKIIVSACDSRVFTIRDNVKEVSEFWIKSQPYSLQDMLDHSPFVSKFVGGSVYQAYLSPFNYHRWHSPISGTIVKAYVKDGLLFSEAESQGIDSGAQEKSQGYITHIQTRAIIFIESDDPEIGLICFMPVGMVEVSSCIIAPKIKPGYHVEKGEELGYFQLGGSTYCLIFGPGVIDKFTVKKGTFCKMGQEIAVAK